MGKCKMKQYDIKTFTELNSTNLYAMVNIANLCDRDIIVAEKQISGYGRFKRAWLSEKSNNLYMSIVLKPEVEDFSVLPLANLTQYLSVALCKTIESFGIESCIKWPNDVLVNGKKIAGILCQTSINGNNLNGIVLGIGVNLNLEQDDLDKIDQPATAMNIELGTSVDYEKFTRMLLDEFFVRYNEFMACGFEMIKSEYISRCSFIGEMIQVKNLDKTLRGIADGIDEAGALLLKCDKSKETIMIGDVLL